MGHEERYKRRSNPSPSTYIIDRLPSLSSNVDDEEVCVVASVNFPSSGTSPSVEYPSTGTQCTEDRNLQLSTVLGTRTHTKVTKAFRYHGIYDVLDLTDLQVEDIRRGIMNYPQVASPVARPNQDSFSHKEEPIITGRASLSGEKELQYLKFGKDKSSLPGALMFKLPDTPVTEFHSSLATDPEPDPDPDSKVNDTDHWFNPIPISMPYYHDTPSLEYGGYKHKSEAHKPSVSKEYSDPVDKLNVSSVWLAKQEQNKTLHANAKRADSTNHAMDDEDRTKLDYDVSDSGTDVGDRQFPFDPGGITLCACKHNPFTSKGLNGTVHTSLYPTLSKIQSYRIRTVDALKELDAKLDECPAHVQFLCSVYQYVMSYNDIPCIACVATEAPFWKYEQFLVHEGPLILTHPSCQSSKYNVQVPNVHKEEIEFDYVSIIFADSNGHVLWTHGIGNTYRNAKTTEQLLINAGPDFGTTIGLKLMIVKAHEIYADVPCDLSFLPSKEDVDLWMSEQTGRYKYVAEKFQPNSSYLTSFHPGYVLFQHKKGTLYFAPCNYIEHMKDSFTYMFSMSSSNTNVQLPIEHGDDPEVDTPILLEAADIRKHMSTIGTMLWGVSLGRLNVNAVMMLSGFRVPPRKEQPVLPNDAQKSLGNPVAIATYVNSIVYPDLLTGLFVTGILHVVRLAPVDCFSKHQTMVETVTPGSELISSTMATDQIIYFRLTLLHCGAPVTELRYMIDYDKPVIYSDFNPQVRLRNCHNALLFYRVNEAIASDMPSFICIPGLCNRYLQQTL